MEKTLHNNQHIEGTHQSKKGDFTAINAIPHLNPKHKKTITDAEQPKKVPNGNHPPKIYPTTNQRLSNYRQLFGMTANTVKTPKKAVMAVSAVDKKQPTLPNKRHPKDETSTFDKRRLRE